jgi:hypothetical protein
MEIVEIKNTNKSINITSYTMSLVDTTSKIVVSNTKLFYSTNIDIGNQVKIQQSIQNIIPIRVYA